MGSSSLPPSVDDLKALAPFHLPSYRGSRYQGENERRILPDFEPRDRDLLRTIYSTLLELFLKLKPLYHDSPASLDILQRFLARDEDTEVSAHVREFGRQTLARKTGVDCSRTIHDLRGGAFQALSLRLELLRSFPEISKSMQNIFFLLRDHLKIMRNCVADLDFKRFAKDAAKQDHAASYLVEKWSIAEFNVAQKPVNVALECLFEGTLCESCLEFSTLDRIIYNMMNNAAKYSADGVVHLSVLPVPEPEPENIRFIVANTISPDHRAILEKAFPRSLSDIFEGGFSTGGHGLGVRICADFCAQAYGINQFPEAREAGHFGARMIGDYFVAWFHWPIATHCD